MIRRVARCLACFFRHLSVLLPALIGLWPACAQAALALDLSEAVSRALKNNPAISQIKEKVSESDLSKSLAGASLFPSVDLTASGQYRKDSVANKNGSSVAFRGDPYNSYQLGLKATQPIFQWGSLAAIRMADYDRQITEKDLEIAQRALVVRVIQAYYKVILSDRLLRLFLDEQRVVSDSLTTAQSRYRTGRGQLIDVLQVKTQLATLRTKIEDSRNELDAAGSELSNALGNSEKIELEIKSELPSFSLKAIETKLNQKSYQLPELERVLLSQERLEEQKSVTLGKSLPNLKLVGDYSFTNYTKSELFDSASKSWSLQLQLSVPLFSGFSSLYERGALASKDAQLELQKKDTGNSLILSQIKSRKTLESAEAALSSAEEAADLAGQSVAEARRNYRLATIDFLQFLQVEKSRIEALSSLNQLKYNAIVAYANFFAASGLPLQALVDLLVQGGRGQK